MKTILLVTLLWPWMAYSKNLSWPQKMVRSYNNHTLAELCKQASKRIQDKVCVGIKKDMLKDKAKFKWTLEASDSLVVSFKNYSTKVKRTDSQQTYLINRKSLYLEEVTGAKDLQKKIEKLLPSSETAVNLWLSPAYADDFPVPEFAKALTLLLFQTSEQEACSHANDVVKSCNKFDKEMVKKLQDICKKDPAAFEKRINGPKALQNMKTLNGQAQIFTAQFSQLDPTKKEALTKCECKEGLCSMAEKKSQLGEDFKNCQQNMKDIASLNEKCGDVDFPIIETVKIIKTVDRQPTADQPALFQEDSYRAKK